MTNRAPDVADLVWLGLTDSEARAYAHLVRAGSCTAREVADATGLGRTRAYNVLDSLLAHGLAETLLGEPRRFLALPIRPFVDRTLEEAARRAEHVERARQRLAQAFRGDRAEEGAFGEIHVVRSRRDATDALARAILSASAEVRWIATPPGVLRLANHPDGADAVRRLADGTVGARVLVLQAASTEATREALALLGGAARAVSAPGPLGSRLLVDAARLLLEFADPDDERAFRGEDFLVDTRVPALVADAGALFEALWADAGAATTP